MLQFLVSTAEEANDLQCCSPIVFVLLRAMELSPGTTVLSSNTVVGIPNQTTLVCERPHTSGVLSRYFA